ncbi:MAG TPA: bifunctional fucokinase/L-fucose-1-P-guanylyltransferase [Candidatus Eisenbergiella merdipullorum]|uniref:Bifunctional fucokinase/L-fucose-1-P-guanylyltransferase n=1 Tax=Candidatus Eisenbergiella merdipullorum TaxID=2838553 RepID=A0A9D2KZ64_9FIRM|nr:bifunctional fucokinase/L-fucose-1-P-guanylyltransferase [Candidatus Eisenbergiella merdipullorum]
MNYKKMKNLFLRQSYLDSWTDYESSLSKPSFIKWDYLVLTASNEEQARTYREQIDYRLKQGRLPAGTHYAVLPDPEGKRVGSGGATLHVLDYIAKREQAEGKTGKNPFQGLRILVIHSGGDSKRVPQYSACGKLFSPVPRELPNGFGSTLFDEFVIGMSGVPSRIPEGMLVLSGDVLLLFNPLQIDFNARGAAAISMKENVETGKEHGVFLNDGHDYVGQFLHKQSEERLRALGAVNSHGNVDLDTGAVVLDVKLLNALYGLISTDGKPDGAKFQEFVNEKARISFYGDFLYPLAGQSTLEQYYKEAAEGEINEELLSCRTKIWDVLHSFSMKLICLSPAEFIHFGTTAELMRLVTHDVEDYEFLDWKKQVVTTAPAGADYAAHNSYVGKRAKIGRGAYLENSFILDESHVGEGSIISGVKLKSVTVPDGVVLHGLKLLDGRYVTRIYGVEDNPKGTLEGQSGGAHFLGSTLNVFLSENGLTMQEIWEEGQEHSLWNARLYPVSADMEESVRYALLTAKMADGDAPPEERSAWRQAKRLSLQSSFNRADVLAAGAWQRELENRILASRFLWDLEAGVYYKDALKTFGAHGIDEDIFALLMKDAKEAGFSLKIRIYYALAQYMKENRLTFDGKGYDSLEAFCFGTIQKTIFDNAASRLSAVNDYRIAENVVDVALPVRVNWGGGWTDTPPHCNERGGTVLNAALKLNGIYPIQIRVERLAGLHVEFASTDIGVSGRADSIEEIQDCHNPYDPFALHKAALIACGIIPLGESGGQEKVSLPEKESLQDICRRLGGGIRLSTKVVGIPQGSGLGTSSILSGACVKGLFRFLGREAADDEIYAFVLAMEQIMSTGGGWQDQVGGLTPGIKFITTRPGIDQEIHVEQVQIPEKTKKELQDRFALIYTGQRRLARNLLRDVVGGYLGGRPESIDALEKMQSIAVLMRFELERGNLDAFAELLNRHWELSRQLDSGSTNTCIEQIFLSCEDMIDARFIAGAGGGGFLQVLLKRGYTKEMLRERLHEIYQESGVDVWDSEFV